MRPPAWARAVLFRIRRSGKSGEPVDSSWWLLAAWVVAAAGVDLIASGAVSAAREDWVLAGLGIILGFNCMADWMPWARAGRFLSLGRPRPTRAERWHLLPQVPGSADGVSLVLPLGLVLAALIAAWTLPRDSQVLGTLLAELGALVAILVADRLIRAGRAA